jgi:pSer/pThr/pTyr-binding forkhead associated (FHA) protein
MIDTGYSSAPDKARDNLHHAPSYFCAPAPAEFEEEIVLDQFPYVLGRHQECNHTLFSRQVSRRHCQFFRRGEQILVEDLNSYNGTFLNDNEVRNAEQVRDGDLLIIHPYRFLCRLEHDAEGNTILRLIPGVGIPTE